MDDLSITIVLGTARKDRESKKVADHLVEVLKREEGVQVRYVDVKEFLFGHTIPSWVEDSAVDPWRDIVSESDAFLFVVPEYNRSYPGELKILLDSAYQQYRKKVAAIAGVSSGDFAGTRVIEHIQPVMTELGLVISPRPIHAPRVEDLFDESGEVSEHRKEAFSKSVEASIESLLWYARALKVARNSD